MVHCKEVQAVLAGAQEPETLRGTELGAHLEGCHACQELFHRLDRYNIAEAVSRHLWAHRVSSPCVSLAVIRLA